MAKNIFISFISIVLLGCIKEESSYTESIISNKTSHNISIIPYYQGKTLNEEIQYINSGENKTVLQESNRGKGTGYSYSDKLAFLDSAQIFFDDTIKIMHYSYHSTNLGYGSSGIQFFNNRSLFNSDNYIRRIVSEKKRSISNEYTFTFTEQDYLNAKNK